MAKGNQELVVVLGADIGGFEQAMSKVKGSMSDTADKISGATDGMSKKTTGAFGKIKSALSPMASVVAGAFVVDKIKDFGVTAIKTAGEMKALNSQFEQVFGDMGDVASENLRDMGKEFGMIPSRLKAPLTQTTSMFKGLGLSTEDAMKRSADAVRLTADASAFYDKSFEDASGSLNSFIKGNYEGGEAIGLFANETQLASWSAENLGLEWKNLDEAGKQIARLEYAEAMQENAGATGQASRESDGLENVLGNLKEAWKQFTAVVGTPLLKLAIPIIKGITTSITFLSGAMTKAGEVIKASPIFQTLSKGVTDAKTKIMDFINGGTLSGIGEQVKTMFGEVSNAFSSGGLSAGIEKIVEFIPIIKEKAIQLIQGFIEGIVENLPFIVETITSFIQNWITNMATMYPMLLEAGLQIITALIQGISEALPMLIPVVIQIIQTLTTMIVENIAIIIEAGLTLLQGIIDGIIQALPTLLPAILQVISTLITAITNNIGMIINAGIQILTALIDGVISMLPQLIPMALNLIVTIMRALLDNLPMIIKAGVEVLLALIDGIIDMLPQLITTAVDLIIAVMTALIDNLPMIIEAGIQILLALIEGLIGAIPDLVGAIPQIITAIKDGFSSVDWGQVGIDLIKGIGSGITSMAGFLKDTIKGVVNRAKEKVKNFFGIGSPSKMFRDEIGKWLPHGMAVGIKKESDVVLKAVDGMNDPVVDRARNLQLDSVGVSGKGATGQTIIKNEFNINATVREDADIDRIIKGIQKKQKINERSGGRVVYGV